MRKKEMIKRGICRMIGAAVFFALVGCAGGTHKTGGSATAEMLRETDDAVGGTDDTEAESDAANTAEAESDAANTAAVNAAPEYAAASDSANDPDGMRREPAVSETAATGVDVDLTSLSATMVFSEVYHMMTSPQDYIGKVIRMEGICAVSQDPTSGKVYYACIVQDATACCSQGIEFERRQQGDDPEAGQNICVTGTFDLYREGDRQYATLRNARLE
ncbi:MAG: hypothetical protein LIV11_07965 [Bacillota bacterium]|nr:hypothetical protein [Bacillota bacterium]